MRRRLLPPIGALTAFESAARHGSIVEAAQELHLSQSAVSRLVRQVESALGVALFERVKQRMVLTEAGRNYAQTVRRTLQAFERATYQTMSYGSANGALSLATFSTFATKWLLPRLPDFQQRSPGISVNCFVRNSPFDFDADPMDAAIHYGEPVWPGAIAVPLFDEDVVPVASPVLAKRAKVSRPRDILDLPLLHEVTRPTAWNQWLNEHGVDHPGPVRGAWFDQFGLIAAAASAGLGVGLVPKFLIEDELADGRLAVLFDSRLPKTHGYFLVYPHRHAGQKIIESFRDWLLEQAPRRGE